MNEFYHYGIKRRSGRYPWGSGENPYQRTQGFLADIKKLEDDGLNEKQIAEDRGMSVKELRARKSIAKAEQRKHDYNEALKLKSQGYSVTKIAERMGKNESSIRAMLDEDFQKRNEVTEVTANMLKDVSAQKQLLDIGAGTEHYLGISRTKLDTALYKLEAEGYHIYNVYEKQAGTGQYTTRKVLAAPGITEDEARLRKSEIEMISKYSDDGGKTFLGIEPPKSIDSDRVAIRYAEDGGKERDGLIEVRRGVPELSLGDARYAQVRIAVDGTHYLKGMAIESDDLPKGVDIMFNTNKNSSVAKLDVLKPLKDDPDNPFGATISRQRHYTDENGNDQLSAVNIVREEGDWGTWSRSLSSQFLSKQNPFEIKKQLDLTYGIRKDEFDEINSITYPPLKQKMLEEFASSCDSAAVHLKAIGYPRQGSYVIVPFSDISEKEIYAPRYNDGEEVALIRYPHAGTFEIPILRVNNKATTASKVMPNAIDGVGINSKVAERLSGADFDGDTVVVIPTRTANIISTPALKGLKDFDPHSQYAYHEGMKVLSKKGVGLKMGDVSNLITDMTIKGAPAEDIVKAVRHSMVVIDANNHKLDYQQSYIDNDIAALKEKYQGSAKSGASTLISRSKSVAYVDERQEVTPDPETGEKRYLYKGKTHPVWKKDKEGNWKVVGYEKNTQKSTKIYEAKTADELLSDSNNRVELLYADYANKLKAMANEARRIAVNIPSPEVNQSSKTTFKDEIETLKSKLRLAEMNAPLERQAQGIASAVVSAKIRDNPVLKEDHDALQKVKNQAIAQARVRTGASKKDKTIDITDREWLAIQSNALNKTTVRKILDNTDDKKLKQRALPKTSVGMSAGKIARAKSMLNGNKYTLAEVSEALGVSVSTLVKAIND